MKIKINLLYNQLLSVLYQILRQDKQIVTINTNIIILIMNDQSMPHQKEIIKKSDSISSFSDLSKTKLLKSQLFSPKNYLTSNKSQKIIKHKMSRYCSQKYINTGEQDDKFRQIEINEDYYCYQILQIEKWQKGKMNKSTKNIKETTSTASKEVIKKISKRDIPSFVSNRQNKKGSTKISVQSNGMNTLQIQKFQILVKLGQGKFGKVYLVQQKITGFILALKVVSKKTILSSGFINQFIKELKIQSYLQHPNIIQLYGFFTDHRCFYTLMEFGCDGQLYDFMTSTRTFTQDTTSYLIKSLLDSVHYIHSLDILHRDIKPENIVLVHGTIKLCDFGWAVNKKTKQQLRGTFCGTPLYLSPQILVGAKYNQKVDLWAIGVLSFEFLTKSSPFRIQSKEQLHRIVTSQIMYPQNTKLSDEYREFIQAILKKNPKERFSSAQLMKMRFITMYEGLQACEIFFQ